mmetsp:Transcript_44190/g.91332  ORF Transcript_44190/g.91332 Transcript_44190/m.91332 type:complete len:213 (-) Transcript_44190:6-644(-)
MFACCFSLENSIGHGSLHLLHCLHLCRWHELNLVPPAVHLFGCWGRSRHCRRSLACFVQELDHAQILEHAPGDFEGVHICERHLGLNSGKIPDRHRVQRVQVVGSLQDVSERAQPGLRRTIHRQLHVIPRNGHLGNDVVEAGIQEWNGLEQLTPLGVVVGQAHVRGGSFEHGDHILDDVFGLLLLHLDFFLAVFPAGGAVEEAHIVLVTRIF